MLPISASGFFTKPIAGVPFKAKSLDIDQMQRVKIYLVLYYNAVTKMKTKHVKQQSPLIVI